MVFVTDSDLIIRIALVVSGVTAMLAVSLMANVLIVRLLSIREERHENAVLDVWRPLIAESAEGVLRDIPALRRKELPVVLAEWSRVQEVVRGEATDNLNRLAHRLDFHKAALRMVAGRPLRNRLIGIITLGHLREPQYRSVVFPLLDSADARISLAAARALVQMAPEVGVPRVVVRAGTRSEWPLVRLAMILKEASAGRVCESLLDNVEKSTVPALPRLLKLMKGIECPNRWAAIQHAIGASSDPDIRAVSLSVLEDPEGLEFARESCAHDTWFVRVQAASALGRIGAPEDVDRLVTMLSDPVWWVRYRAAEALIELPSTSTEEMKHLSHSSLDRFARDILREALAEAESE